MNNSPPCDTLSSISKRKVAKNALFGVEKPRCHTALIIYCVSFTSRRLLLVEAFIISPHFVRDKLLHFALLPPLVGGHPTRCESKSREATRCSELFGKPKPKGCVFIYNTFIECPRWGQPRRGVIIYNTLSQAKRKGETL